MRPHSISSTPRRLPNCKNPPATSNHCRNPSPRRRQRRNNLYISLRAGFMPCKVRSRVTLSTFPKYHEPPIEIGTRPLPPSGFAPCRPPCRHAQARTPRQNPAQRATPNKNLPHLHCFLISTARLLIAS